MSVKRALNWLVVLAGALLGILGLARLGLQDPALASVDRWWFSFILASVLFAVVPLLGSTLAALNKRRLAAVSFFVVVPIFVRWAFLNSHTWLSDLYAWFAVICLALGLYWLLVWRKNWPPLMHSLSARRSLLVSIVSLLTIAVLDLSATLAFVVGPCQSTIDCHLPAVFSRSTFGHDAVFTAHLTRVGHQVWVSDRWMGNWALATVEDRFWGWPFPRFVLLTVPGYGYGFLRSGEDYLVDGRRPSGALTRFLPIVEIRGCNRTQRLVDAALDLRLLKSGFPKDDVRIMGRVDRWVHQETQDPTTPQEYLSMPRAKLEIVGPRGIVTTMTDQEGIYDLVGLPPGKYQVRLPTNSSQERPVALMDFPSNLEAGQVAEYSFSFRRTQASKN